MKPLRMAMCLLSVVIACALANLAAAETSSELRAKADRYRAAIPNKVSALETIQTRIKAYEQKKVEAQAQLDQARKDLIEAQTNMTIAKADTSDEAERLQSIGERRLELAERTLKSREKRSERAVIKHTELTAEQQKLQDEMKWMEGQIPELLTKADNQETAEIRNAKQKKEAQLAALAPPPPVSTPSPTAEPTPEPIELASADGQSFILPASASNAEGASNARQQYARGEMKKLLELTRNADRTNKPRRDDPVLNVDGEEIEELEYLGAKQYYTEVPLAAGRYKVAIGARKFVATIPASADGNIFVVIFDTADTRTGRVAFFNKKHLE
ncbi:hypothetical protein [Teredinibacter franksiae]|uniref:hypothetical protein n=1 Tax=Teredinibacter franksiae TaxID=2761453 RepID=UPI00162AA449|nr:hypothetical protein [Teredinibacter franksiae]